MQAEILTVVCLLMMFWCVRLLLRAKDHFKAVNGIAVGGNENPRNVPPEESPASASATSTSTQMGADTLHRNDLEFNAANQRVKLSDEMSRNGEADKHISITRNGLINIINGYISEAVTANTLHRNDLEFNAANQRVKLSDEMSRNGEADKHISITRNGLINIINGYISRYKTHIQNKLNKNEDADNEICKIADVMMNCSSQPYKSLCLGKCESLVPAPVPAAGPVPAAAPAHVPAPVVEQRPAGASVVAPAPVVMPRCTSHNNLEECTTKGCSWISGDGNTIPSCTDIRPSIADQPIQQGGGIIVNGQPVAVSPGVSAAMPAAQPCVDIKTDCPTWAELGYCRTKSQFMQLYCHASCGFCQP